jgi:hypothetical protein
VLGKHPEAGEIKMSDDEHFDAVRDRTGKYYKTSNYRTNCETCGKGFHGQFWEAHHILPYEVFKNIKDPFILQCLGVTNYDINNKYSMGGLPRLDSYILYYQNDPSMPPLDKDLEKQVTMAKWGDIDKKYPKRPATKPKDLPCHNPVNFGHTVYNKEVFTYLNQKIFRKLLKKKKQNAHFAPENVRSKLMKAKNHFWDKLKERGTLAGGGGCVGIEENLRHRYGKAKDGWWKPLCMTDVPEPKSS